MWLLKIKYINPAAAAAAKSLQSCLTLCDPVDSMAHFFTELCKPLHHDKAVILILIKLVDEMVGWHHRLNGHGFGWSLGVGDGQGGLACCGSWGHKESDTTEQLN